MSDEAARAVLNGTATTGNTRLVQLCLGTLADHTGKVTISQVLLARAAQCHQRTAATALRELEATGQLAIVEPAHGPTPATYQLLYPRRDTRVRGRRDTRVKGRCDTGVLADARGNTPFTELLTTNEGLAADATATRRQAAAQLVRAVYDERSPKPVAKRVAVVKMAERFLEAGWTEHQVQDAMMTTATFTDQALQLQLNRGLGGQARRAEPPSGPSVVAGREQSRSVNRAPWVCAVGNADCDSGYIDTPTGAKPCECRTPTKRPQEVESTP